jgi:hypothetical protein
MSTEGREDAPGLKAEVTEAWKRRHEKNGQTGARTGLPDRTPNRSGATELIAEANYVMSVLPPVHAETLYRVFNWQELGEPTSRRTVRCPARQTDFPPNRSGAQPDAAGRTARILRTVLYFQPLACALSFPTYPFALGPWTINRNLPPLSRFRHDVDMKHELCLLSLCGLGNPLIRLQSIISLDLPI